MITAAVPPGRTAFVVHCAACRHEWVAFYMPLAVDLIKRFRRLFCPMCANSMVMVGDVTSTRREQVQTKLHLEFGQPAFEVGDRVQHIGKVPSGERYAIALGVGEIIRITDFSSKRPIIVQFAGLDRPRAFAAENLKLEGS